MMMERDEYNARQHSQDEPHNYTDPTNFCHNWSNVAIQAYLSLLIYAFASLALLV